MTEPIETTQNVLPDAPQIPQRVHQMQKRLPYLILTILFVVGFFCFLNIRDIDEWKTDPNMPWFSISDGTLYFDSSLYSGSEELIVPNSICGETVLSLSSGCFSYCTQLTTVHLPESLEYIDAGAFYGCTSLRGIYIPDSVLEIGQDAFGQCSSLESLYIPGSVSYIGDGAFEGCTKLMYIFYNGYWENWHLLYAEPIAPQTYIYAIDGTFRHSSST